MTPCLARRADLFAGIAAAAALGCASTQTIPLEPCLTEKMQIYVDGRLLEENPDALELRADEPHTLYVKRPGHEPQLVVLEPTPDADGRLRLVPGDVCLELVPVGLDRELVIEAEDDEAR